MSLKRCLDKILLPEAVIDDIKANGGDMAAVRKVLQNTMETADAVRRDLRRQGNVDFAPRTVKRSAEVEQVKGDDDAGDYSVTRDDEVRTGTFFSGAGTMEAALKAALGGRMKHAMAVEYMPEIANAYQAAHGVLPTVGSVHDITPQQFIDSGANYFHASPVCKNFSKAKNDRTVEESDMESARSVARVISQVNPPVVTVENVPAYLDTVPYKLITEALTREGYKWDVVRHNAADYGGASNRSRIIVRAVKEGELPPVPTKTEKGDWYKAVESLLEDAPRDSEGMPAWEKERFAKMAAAGKIDMGKPILSMGGSANHETVHAANAGQPGPELKATKAEVPRIYLPNGETIRVTPRMMARLMDLPDGYRVPNNVRDAKLVLGNGIQGKATEKIIAPLFEREVSKDAGDYSVAKDEGDDVPRSAKLANPGETPTARALFRMSVEETRGPGKRDLATVERDIRNMTPESVEKVRQRMLAGENLSDTETVLAKDLINAEVERLQNFVRPSNDRSQKQLEKIFDLNVAFSAVGTAQGRALAARADRWLKPEERIAEVGNWINDVPERVAKAYLAQVRAGNKEQAEKFRASHVKAVQRTIAKVSEFYGMDLGDYAVAAKDPRLLTDMLSTIDRVKAQEGERAMAEAKLQRFSRAYHWTNTVNAELVRSALLSGPTTHAKNAISNTLNGTYKLLQKSIEMAIEGHGEGVAKAMPALVKHAWVEGFHNFTRTLSAEHDVLARRIFGESDAHYDQRASDIANSSTGRKFLRLPLRAMGAADAFFKTVYARTSVVMEAYREIHTKNPKASKAEVDEYIAKQIGDFNSNAWRKAYAEAHEVSFQELSSSHTESTDGSLTKKFATSLVGLRENVPLVGPLILPFIMTPMAILRQAALRSPIGGVRLAVRMMQDKMYQAGDKHGREYTPNQMRRDAIDAAMGTIAMSLAAATLGGMRDDKDRPILTGSAADFTTERGKRDAESGKEIAPPMSIKVGDKWVSYAALEPFASLLQPAADYRQTGDKGDSQMKTAKKTLNAVLSKSSLTSIGDLWRAVTSENDANFANYVAGVGTMYAPRILTAPYKTFEYDEDRPVRPRNPDAPLGAGEEEPFLTQAYRIGRDKVSLTSQAKPRIDLGGREVPAYATPNTTLARLMATAGAPISETTAEPWRELIYRHNETRTGGEKEWWPLGWSDVAKTKDGALVMTQQERYDLHKKYGTMFATAASKIVTDKDLADPRAPGVERKIEALRKLRSAVGTRMLREFRMIRKTAQDPAADAEMMKP